MAFSESPPPTTEIAPESATALASATVPLSKGGISKTPIGPFQMMVLAPAIIASYSAMVFSPMSSAILPSGISVDGFVLRAGFEFRRHDVIDRQHELRPACSASSLLARSSLSSSTSDLPVG